MKKAHNFKPRDADNTTKHYLEAKKAGLVDDFDTTRQRGWGVCRDLTGRNHVTVDWRAQWGNEEARKYQVFELIIGKEKATVSYEELYRLLRHT